MAHAVLPRRLQSPALLESQTRRKMRDIAMLFDEQRSKDRSQAVREIAQTPAATHCDSRYDSRYDPPGPTLLPLEREVIRTIAAKERRWSPVELGTLYLTLTAGGRDGYGNFRAK